MWRRSSEVLGGLVNYHGCSDGMAVDRGGAGSGGAVRRLRVRLDTEMSSASSVDLEALCPIPRRRRNVFDVEMLAEQNSGGGWTDEAGSVVLGSRSLYRGGEVVSSARDVVEEYSGCQLELTPGTLANVVFTAAYTRSYIQNPVDLSHVLCRDLYDFLLMTAVDKRCPLETLATLLMTMVSYGLGRDTVLDMGGGHLVRSNVFLFSVSPSGTGKTTAYDLVVDEPSEYLARVWELSGPMLVNHTTVPAILKACGDSGGRLLFINDEVANVMLGLFNGPTEMEFRTILNKLWSGQSLTKFFVTQRNHDVKHVHFSVGGPTHPEPFGLFLAKCVEHHDGLLDRIFFVCAPCTKRRLPENFDRGRYNNIGMYSYNIREDFYRGNEWPIRIVEGIDKVHNPAKNGGQKIVYKPSAEGRVILEDFRVRVSNNADRSQTVSGIRIE